MVAEEEGQILTSRAGDAGGWQLPDRSVRCRQVWCCSRKHIGCAFDCRQDLKTWEATATAHSSSHSSLSPAGLLWQVSWTGLQKTFCCQHFHVGCEGGRYDCAAGRSEYAYSMRAWLRQVQGGCKGGQRDTSGHPCGPTTSGIGAAGISRGYSPSPWFMMSARHQGLGCDKSLQHHRHPDCGKNNQDMTLLFSFNANHAVPACP